MLTARAYCYCVCNTTVLFILEVHVQWYKFIGCLVVCLLIFRFTLNKELCYKKDAILTILIIRILNIAIFVNKYIQVWISPLYHCFYGMIIFLPITPI